MEWIIHITSNTSDICGIMSLNLLYHGNNWHCVRLYDFFFMAYWFFIFICHWTDCWSEVDKKTCLIYAIYFLFALIVYICYLLFSIIIWHAEMILLFQLIFQWNVIRIIQLAIYTRWVFDFTFIWTV